MAAQALYRRWRPQSFDEVVGQTPILQTLRNALTSGRIAHAYLFAGPRGTGKTTIARILARAVNCETEASQRPCGVCGPCRSLAEGRALDLIEIDAASHTGVDNVRDLIEKVQFAPTETRYKVYIIDEVHMLSTPAFNALLKTLEEPPPHALFFLATTEAHKIPATILSRCQRFTFQRIPLDETVEHLSRICAAEGFTPEPAALELIARQAQGGMRDAISLLDQMVAFCGESVSLAQVQAALGTAADAAVEAIADQIALADTATGLRLINQAVDAGVDPRQLVAQLLEYLRGLMLIQNGGGSLLNVTAEQLDRMGDQARRMSPAALVRAIRLFSEAAVAQRGSLQPQLPAELALVEATLEAARSQPAAQPPMPAPPTALPRPVPMPAASAPPPATKPATAPLAPLESNPAGEASPPLGPVAGDGVLDIYGQWEAFCAAVDAQSKRIGALLKDCQPLDATADSVTLGVYYPFHQKQLDDTKNRVVVEDALARMFGRRVRLAFKLTPKSKAEIEAERPRSPHQEAVEDPVVQEALKMGGKIAGVSTDS